MGEINIFTDGACSGNPGPGGWAALLCTVQRRWEIAGSDPHTTNNRMEMMAAIRALQEVAPLCPNHGVCVHSDSQYLVTGITKWIFGWRSKAWRTSQGKPVENRELWEELWDASQSIPLLSWKWVRGHSGHPENEHVNALAQRMVLR